MKNLLLSISMLAIAASASAQLYVGPIDVNTTPGDKEDDVPTFIYANNQVVYVTQGVQLEENPEGIYNASFYLRNKSQLLQGNIGTDNSGSGYLSVTQDSHSDSYDYNMWASPVSNQYFGSPTAAIAGNRNYGIASVIKDSLSLTNSRDALRTDSWNGSGSGMDNPGDFTQLIVSDRWMYKYENDVSGYQRLYGMDGVAPGYGFIMKGTNSTTHMNVYIDDNNQRYDFRGRPNNGTIAVAIASNDNIMSGNPYPSALDLQAFVVDNNNPTGKINSILFWEENRTVNSHRYLDNIAGYDTCVYNGVGVACTQAALMRYDNSGNPITGAGMGQVLNRRHAAMGQGYFIVTEPGASGTVTYENSHRALVIENEDEASGDNIFRRPGSNDSNPNEAQSGEINNYSLEKFTRSNGIGAMRFHTSFIGDQTFFRDMILFVGDETTDGHDTGYDAYHPGVGTTDIFFPITASDNIERNYVMQGVPFEEKKFIPLTIKISGDSRKITMETIELINFNTKAYFYDLERDIAQPMYLNELVEFELKPGVYKNRFYIILGVDEGKSFNEAMNEDANEKIDQATEDVSFFQNNRASQLEISNPEQYEIKVANIFDMTGKLVITKSNIGALRNFNLPTSNLSDGVYLVKLTTEDNVVIDYKMTVTN